MAYPERAFNSAADDESTTTKTAEAILDHVLASYTYKSYNMCLLENLATGITEVPMDVNIPAEVKNVLRWHNGYIDPYSEHTIILPGELRLLSLEEALGMASEELEDADGEDSWNADFPIFARENRELMIVVSHSTGKAAYRSPDSSLTDPDDMKWFPSLSSLLRKVEKAMEEGMLCVRFKNGMPWSIDTNGVEAGTVAPITVDSDDEREADREEAEKNR
ncbi:hypothetical protein C8R44DRAFT_728246 [Mycena epipterygia]|nr:hypothetical protein C8R44DRAFT_728246 [Mycena epipterygia]